MNAGELMDVGLFCSGGGFQSRMVGQRVEVSHWYMVVLSYLGLLVYMSGPIL